jgi:hypothetical protein
MRQNTVDNYMGIQWTFTKQLGDLDFADDVDLLPSKLQHAHTKLNKLLRKPRRQA